MTQHTPTPWAISEHAGGNIVSGKRIVANCMSYTDSRDTEGCRQENIANSGFIVLAINNHARAIRTLEEALQYVDGHEGITAEIRETLRMMKN